MVPRNLQKLVKAEWNQRSLIFYAYDLKGIKTELSELSGCLSTYLWFEFCWFLCLVFTVLNVLTVGTIFLAVSEGALTDLFFCAVTIIETGTLALVSCQIVRTLSLFLTPTERKCSRLCRSDSSFKYDTGLFVQGLLKVVTSSLFLFLSTVSFELQSGVCLASFFVRPDFETWIVIVGTSILIIAEWFLSCW